MRHFFAGLGLAFRGYAQSFRTISACKLGWVFAVPLLILLLNLWVGGNLAYHLTAHATDWFRDIIPFSMGNGWLAGLIRTLSAFIVWLSLFFVMVYVGGTVLLILLSPLLAYISERVEAHLTGRSYPFRLGELLSDIVRGIRIALRNLAVEVGLTAALFLVGLIPAVGFLVPFVLFGVAAYYYGFAFMDYTLERRRYTVRQSIALVRRHRGAAVGLGAGYMLLTTIPFVGLALAGFASILSEVAATLACNELAEER
ncbi:EI24 domain-containing protein [uncultured Acetobacteroides sp.]|uniref:EI24 domain-containing protein n=1 Tax=uncultured Acetobacteroides sp. TaxID=1760811 RepID=UPI0029F4AC02|nr:EI24 domain-containing protein [uncultured Acetobacteroides sp.]